MIKMLEYPANAVSLGSNRKNRTWPLRERQTGDGGGRLTGSPLLSELHLTS